jgi:hypothetical protein
MYNVVVLAEQGMTPADAREVVSLHESIDDTRHYHLLIPCDDAAVQASASTAVGTSIGGDPLSTPGLVSANLDIAGAQRAIDEQAASAVARSIEALQALGVEASGEFSTDDPVDRLIKVVADRRADEVIVMTLSHSISELFHLDWTSKARRRLGVPTLHLLEHQPLEADAGEGEGITGM